MAEIGENKEGNKRRQGQSLKMETIIETQAVQKSRQGWVQKEEDRVLRTNNLETRGLSGPTVSPTMMVFEPEVSGWFDNHKICLES